MKEGKGNSVGLRIAPIQDSTGKEEIAGEMDMTKNERSSRSLLVWASPSTKGAGAYQLWENYRGPVAQLTSKLVVLRGHDEHDSVSNPQIKLNAMSVFWVLTGFRKILRQGEPTTHVVTSISQSDILYGLVARWYSKAHWTIYVLGQPYPVKGQTNTIKSALWKKLWLLAAKRADRIIAVSDYIGQIISDELPDFRIQTVYPSLGDAGSFERQAKDTPPDNLRVGFVGRLSPEKDPALFCRIMDGVAGVEAKIYGDGPLRKEIEAVLNRVKLLGFKAQDEIYSNIDVLVMTSKSEGLPMVLVEASYAGIVPLVIDVGGCAEAIHPENRSVLVIAKEDRENLSVWQERFRLIENLELRTQLIQRQLDWASLKFEVSDNSRMLVDLVTSGADK